MSAEPEARWGPPLAGWNRHPHGPWSGRPHGHWSGRRHGPRSGLTLAVVIGAIQVGGTYLASRHQVPRRPLDLLGFALLVAGPAALIWRRRWPEAALLAAFGATLAYWELGYPRGPIFFALVVALLRVVISGRRPVAWAVLAAGFAAFLWLGPLLRTEAGPSLANVLGLGAWLLVLLAVGEWIRTWGERAREMGRTRQEEARRRASEERLQIARELHDVLAHSISLINVQAGVALHLMDEQPEQARTALTAIRDASKDTLRELRAVLGVLRHVDEEAPRAPAAGLAQLEDLVAKASAGGMRVEVHVEGSPRTMPLGVDLAAYRIVQEALTNVSRHAGATAATVRLVYGERDLTVEVDDDGHGGVAPDGSPGSGSGIAGMRERAEALGGRLRAGPRPRGGFRVTAQLPEEGRR